MKVGLFLCTLVVLGGFAAHPSYAQQQTQQSPAKTVAKTVAKPVSASPGGSPGSRQGSVGGPVSKGAKINGTGMKLKH
ncbi:MAG: hypothetical protein ACLQJR_20860 [Stellaceae bacterium]